MTARTRRRRGLALLAVALACGALAASEVGDRVRAVEARVGAPVPGVVAARDLEPGAELGRDDLRVSHVPARFAPPDAPTSPGQALGLHTAGPVAAGSPITAGVVGATTEDGAPGTLRRGERAVEVTVAGGAALLETAPGARADVVVSTDPGDGPGSSFVALEDVELLALAPGAGTDTSLEGDLSAGAGGAAIATLRVTLRQAVYLTAAQSYAREIRLLPRPPGDDRRVGRAAVGADDL